MKLFVALSTLLVLVFSCLPSTCTYAQKDMDRSTLRTLRKGSRFFTGEFSNKAQADTSNSPIHAHQIIKGVYLDFSTKMVKYVHMAWFHPDNEAQPLDQRIFRFEVNETEDVVVTSFYVPKSKNKTGSWRLDEKLFTTDDLKQDVCKLYLKEEEKKVYRLVPSEPYCISSVIGGAYHAVKLDFELSRKQLVMYNSFFDKKGKLLFGYPNGSFFVRR